MSRPSVGHRLLDRLRTKLQRWLIPRSGVSAIVMTVELDGVEKMRAELDDLEDRLDRLIAKGNRAHGVLESLPRA